jgi:hypothetical protein
MRSMNSHEKQALIRLFRVNSWTVSYFHHLIWYVTFFRTFRHRFLHYDCLRA